MVVMKILSSIIKCIFLTLTLALPSYADETRYITPNSVVFAGESSNTSYLDDITSASPISIGFTFNFGGINYTTLGVNTNGVLYFAGLSSEHSNYALSDLSEGQLGVYALWDDLVRTANVSKCLHYTAGTVGSRVFIMQWTNWGSYRETYEVGTFNIVLHEGTNKIDIYYRNMLGASASRKYGNEATIGLKITAATQMQYSINSPTATEGKLLTYTPSGGGTTSYTLQERIVTPATTASIQTYFLTHTSSPKIPANLSANPSTPMVTTAQLSWDLGDLGQDPDGYEIRYSTDPGMAGLTLVSSLPATPRSYMLPSLTQGTIYYWQVVSKKGSLSSVSQVSSFVQRANNTPVATGASLVTVPNTAANGTMSATDADSDPLIYSVSTAPTSGTVQITNSATGAFTYTPATDYTGTLTFGFKAFDGMAYSEEATISITVGGAEIVVLGNSVEITDGDESPSTTDHTEFGIVNIASGSSQRTFSIRNDGMGALNLTGNPRVAISGSNAFTVSTQPTAATVAVEASVTFTITFDPSALDSQTATVSIASNDSAKSPYTFNIHGTGHAVPTIVYGVVTNITGYVATLNSTVTLNGPATSYHYEYSTDPTMSTGVVSTATQNLAASYGSASANVEITGLLPETVYHYRLVATNDIGEDTNTQIPYFKTSYPLATSTSYNTANGLESVGLMYRPLPGIINNEGRILFASIGLKGAPGTTVNAANDGWLMNDVTGTPMIIMREGDQLGSNSGHYFTALFNHLLLGESGQSVVSEKLSGTTASNDLAYIAAVEPGTIEVISQEGDTAPDGGTLTNSVGKPVMDSDERIYIQGNTSGGPTTRATGIWYDHGDGLQPLLRAGHNLTSITGDIAWLGKVSNINAAGGNGVAFVAALQPNPANTKQKTNTLRNQVILSVTEGNASNVSLVARKGDSVRGAANIKINSFTALSRGISDNHAYIGLLKTGVAGITKNNDQVLVTVVDGESVIIAREGITNLTGGLTPKSFGKFFVSSNGDVIFQAVLNGATAATDGILCRWIASNETLTVLAREGSPAATTGLNYGAFQNISVSDNGNIALQSSLSNGKIGLFRNTGAGFELVVKAGTTAADRVNYLGVDRNIASLSIYSQNTGTGNGGGGMGSAINDKGDVFTVLSLGGTHYVARVFRGVQTPQ